MNKQPPVALSIAGSDSGCGAGIQVDLKTLSAHGVFATTAITAVTIQNTFEVRGVFPVPSDVVKDQILAVLDDFDVLGAKTGMLASSQTVKMVGQLFAKHEMHHLVVDPVMISSTGTRLLDTDAKNAYVEFLLPIASIVTPNIGEAEVLSEMKICSLADMERSAISIFKLGARNVLVKGGHLDGDQSIDVFFNGNAIQHFSAQRIDSMNNHGTGCTLSAAILAGLVNGSSLVNAIRHAKQYVSRALESSVDWKLGAGHGPLNHGIS